MGFGSVLREELRALPRGRFSLLAACLALGFAALLAALFGVDHRARLNEFLLPACLAPLVLVPFAAAQVSGARASRFLQGVFTTPVTATQYLMAKVAVVLLVGLAYLAALLPFVGLELLHVGASPGSLRHLLLGLGLVAYAATFGTLLGVLFTSRGSLAAVSVSVGVMMVAFLAMANLRSVHAMEPGLVRDAALRLMHLSPAVLLLDALGLHNGMASESPALSALAFLALCAGSLLAAWWVFARRQSPEGWELRGPSAALLVALAVVAVSLAPAALASPDYGPGAFRGYSWNGGGSGLQAQVVPRGGALEPQTPFDGRPLDAGVPNEVDDLVFVFLREDEQPPLRDVEVRLSGLNLTIDPPTVRLAEVASLERGQPYKYSPQEGTFFRVPVTLTPAEPLALSGTPHDLRVNATFRAAGNDTLLGGEATILLTSAIPHASLQMVLAGAPLPLWALGAFVVRRARSR